MHRSIVLILALIMPVVKVIAQISDGGAPYSSLVTGLKSTVAIPQIQLKSYDIAELLAEDESNPIPYRYALFEDTVIDIKSSGKADRIGGKGNIWRFRIQSGQAKSMQIHFKKFVLPTGARLFIYNESQSIIRGAFTQKNMLPDSTLILADFPGTLMIVEYFEPDNPEFSGEIIMGSISQAYKDVLTELSGEPYININCPAGKDVQLNKHAVSKVTFMSDGISYLCSGSLINNARNDETPYFLIAHHCISKANEASTMVAYFNYEIPTCDGEALTPLTLSGASLLTTADSSDFTLLQLSTQPPNTYQPYYAGWDARDTVAKNVVGIHHPLGLTKKLSIDYDTIFATDIDITWDESLSFSPAGSHWVVGFDLGMTDGGSSGSPLFNEKKQIIGQLHGGGNNYDLYGSLAYSYANPPTGYPPLKEFLDPDNTGLMVLDGYYPADNPPDAFFTVPEYKVCINAPVRLRDYSVFAPYDRNWIITPTSFAFADGTSESSPNPVIEFADTVMYTVSLIVSSSFGKDTMKISDGIRADNTIDIAVNNLSSGEICLCDFKQIKLAALGADSYSWSVLPQDADKVEVDAETGDTVTISILTGYNPEVAYSFDIITVGQQGTCADTLQSTFEVLKPENDEIANAIQLSYGKSILYNNICATVETGEPIPPFTSCTSQLSWCDEYGTGEDIVENSVWFKFIAPGSGKVRLWSTGMDNEIALYEANSEADILNSNYTLLGANDDRTDTDYHPNIRSADVIPGNTYWIQVDGSGGGLEDNFYMHLYEMISSETPDLFENKLLVYPQPASDYVFLKGDVLTTLNTVSLEIFNAAGTLVLQENRKVDQGTLVIDVSNWETGIYLSRVHAGQTVWTARIVKY